ncbi:hypothetical protein ABBQ38_008773 [Trebouxia sp. C0009 RCD-2024]
MAEALSEHEHQLRWIHPEAVTRPPEWDSKVAQALCAAGNAAKTMWLHCSVVHGESPIKHYLAVILRGVPI